MVIVHLQKSRSNALPAPWSRFVPALVLSLLILGSLSGPVLAQAPGLLTLHLADDKQVQPMAPGPDAETLARYDENDYAFVAAQPIDWTFTPTVDTTITSIGGSVWFRSEAFTIERDLAPAHSAYELALAQGTRILAYTQADSDDAALPPQPPRGDYRIDFPTERAHVHLAAGETVELWVLVWSSNGGPCLSPSGTFPCSATESDLAVLFGSQAHDSVFALGVA